MPGHSLCQFYLLTLFNTFHRILQNLCNRTITLSYVFQNFFSLFAVNCNFFLQVCFKSFGVKSINFSFMVLALGLEKLSSPQDFIFAHIFLNAFIFSICPWHYFVYLEFMSVQCEAYFPHTFILCWQNLLNNLLFSYGLEMLLIVTCWVTLCINTCFNFCPLDSSPFIFPVRPN